jgi:tetratricopeptide (TPR) repeat protein/transglutaminase-like putative cysteine protease
MSKSAGLNALVLLWFGSPLLTVAQVTNQTPAGPDHSREAFVLEQSSDKFKFQNDGTSSREINIRVRVQSDAGVQQFGVLKFSYQSSSESFAVDYVRVRKPNDSLVVSPPENFQDMPADVTREAPFYSDIQEKHVAVKGLGPGDVLEYRAHWQRTKPLASGQFWLEYSFAHEGIVLAEEVQVSVPRDREIKMKSLVLQPKIRDEGQFRIYTWNNANLEHKDENKQKQEQKERIEQIARGQLPLPDLQLSTYQSWDEVGRWYANLQRDRVKPSAEIQAKAAELTKGANDDLAKTRALYSFVSTRYRYIGIAFGIGRYQSHSAADVLENQYGDCKDKHTLLASMLYAVGIRAYPALISSTRDIDAEVPSPGQFDHVITAVQQGNGFVWLDSTVEVGPFGYLVPPLRDKRALVIPDDKPSELMTSPADLPFPALQTFHMEAKLNDNGTLEGKAEHTVRGDREVLLRAAFRAVALPQWKDLVQQVSFGAGFGGEVSEVSASAPEKTDEAFHISYNYKRKDYSDWSNRRISPPLPMISLPNPGDEESKPPSTIWLGAPGEIQFRAQLELPKGYVPQLPPAVHIKREFADYDASYAVKDAVLSAERRLVIKEREVRPKDYEEYKKFRELVDADYVRYTVLSTGKRAGVSSYQEAIWELPYSSNPEAARAYDEARDEFQKNNILGEIASLRHAVDIDPKFARAWLWLGEIYKFTRQADLALQAYQKAVEVAPQEPVSYKALGFTLMGMRKFEEAIPVWQNFSKVAPDDSDGPANLATCLSRLKRYQEAASALESAVKINPERAGLQFQLGSVYLQSGSDEKALATFKLAIEADSGSDTLTSDMLNSVAYELAEEKKGLSQALQYAEKAVHEAEEKSSKLQLSLLDIQDDLTVSNGLAAYWDTLGWVHFRLGNLDKAEKYLKAAWTVTQDAVIGDHLGQVYENLGKRRQAARAYRLALQVMGRNGDPQMRDRLQSSVAALSGGANSSSVVKDAGAELSDERTYKLPQIRDWGGGYKSAEFVIALTREPGVADTKFLTGAQELRSASAAFGALESGFPFPDDSHARVVRRGVLSCSEVSKGCVFVFYPANAIAQPSVGIPLDQQ